jgi:hypothetical protein
MAGGSIIEGADRTMLDRGCTTGCCDALSMPSVVFRAALAMSAGGFLAATAKPAAGWRAASTIPRENDSTSRASP